MAELHDHDFSLMSLEEELTCSICLSPFSCPVTIPCGHNFCQSCILETWTDSYICPQCRTVFPGKPELKKNTVLSAVVETFNQRASRAEVKLQVAELEPQGKDVIRCDTCMHTEASRTCLTCMASFCEEHLRPHRENPVFRLHQLTVPVGDLLERICSDHHKLMEFFCSQHGRPICSLCLQQVHKGCPFMSPEEQRIIKESDLRSKLDLLDGKIDQNENVITQMRDLQNKMKESALNRKRSVSAEYQQIKDLLARDERDALNAVDRELESGQTKLKVLMKKFAGNVDSMNKAKEDVRCLLGQSQTLAFLQASFNLPAATNFDPYTPRINLDSKKVKAAQAFPVALREHLTEMIKQPVEDRQLSLKPTQFPEKQSFHSKEQKTPQKVTTKGPQNVVRKNFHSSKEMLVEFGEAPRSSSPAAHFKHQPVSLDKSSDLTSVKERSELLEYLTDITLDPMTAHKRIVLSEAYTKASVSEQHLNYPDSPERFSVCSQVLGSEGFCRGRFYWEVQLSSSNFVGIGLAYSNMDRKGPTSRLGRNAQSWCVEWFNIKLSAWHNSTETVLANPVPKCVGVLLDCDNGTATFYSVADKAYPFHSFVFPFHGALFPAFWIFSSGSSISLRTVKA
ncbi:E3 ubiquitin/ISG15 ligase TRIM25-like isoform X10 [Nelusetta ayraudi]|uniref:E3 ubiquitin/ISG15 ligase TRIM25-like isoform X10 n=1 Tax=Nelusetta ayraudi TaxID=303726 RepID=UPI003F722FF8